MKLVSSIRCLPRNSNGSIVDSRDVGSVNLAQSGGRPGGIGCEKHAAGATQSKEEGIEG